MNNESRGTKPMWSNVRYYLYFFLEEMRKIMEDRGIIDLWADF
jgi:ferric iron reductase protein FhuF